MKYKKMLAMLAACAALFGTASANDGGFPLKVKNKDWKGTEVVLCEGMLLTAPEVLEKGGVWQVTKAGETYYVSVPTGEDGRTAVRLPVEEDGRIDLGFFAARAGLSYKLNEKKKEIKFSRVKQKKEKKDKKNKKEEPRRVLMLWDPEKSFGESQGFFPKDAGRLIISPTWGSYKDISAGELAQPIIYMKDAAWWGADVMPLVHNDFAPEETAAFLSDAKAQDDFLAHMEAYAEVYGLAGWNMDFENMAPADKEKYSALIEKLAARMHRAGCELSVDVTVIGSETSYWNGCYERARLAEAADRLVLMGYDQTAGGSRYAGPVSAYDWLDRCIPPLLEEIPAEKLVLGLPFYTRVWRGEAGAARADVLTQKYTKDFIRRHHIIPKWREAERQYHLDWREKGVRCEVWFEEEKSLGEKLSLLAKYDLAGAAFWRCGFEDPSLYEALAKALEK